MKFSRSICTGLAFAGVLAAQPAHAQNAAGLYGGYRAGSGFRQNSPTESSVDMRSSGTASLALEWPYDAGRQLQLWASHQRTRLNLGAGALGSPSELPLRLTYVHLGGLNFFDGRVGSGPYVAGGIGLTAMTPRLPGTSSRVRPSLNIGVGHHWPITPALALRTELRAHVTLINSDGSFFCSGGCMISIKGDTLTQVEALAGLNFSF